MPYHVGEKGSYGCSGYPVVKDGTSEVMGCHDSAAAAQNQITAINISEAEKTQGRKRIPSGVEGFEPAAPGLSALDGQAYEEKDTITNEGGIAGFSWSRAIVERNKDKALFSDIFGAGNMLKAKDEYYDKRERTMETRRRLAESGQAMEDGSYPIVTVEDLRNAIQSVGRAKDYEAARRHIMRRARALGRTDLLPAEWTGEKFWDIRDLTKTDRFMVKADSLRVGQMVSWNSSGGRAQGKVTRIIRSGSYNVPNSDFVIDATEENPAVVITLYRDGKPTDTTVAHRMSTLRAI